MISQHQIHGTVHVMSRQRPQMDPSIRLRTYGKIRPMAADRTWWERLLRR
ncbi:hypothetical protein [Novosphingobium sp.]|nr:hypothetical protein [Novosphingobium sp.]